MALAVLFAIFAALGLLLVVLDFAAKANSPAPSMYCSDIAGVGIALFVICGLIALASWASFR